MRRLDAGAGAAAGMPCLIELLPLEGAEGMTPQQAAALFTVRHVRRTSPTQTTVLGVYYILEGVIYKSPTVRGVMKANVARTLEGLSEACDALSACARYDPSTGYVWRFEPPSDGEDGEDEAYGVRERRRRKRRKWRNAEQPEEYGK